MKFIFTFLLGTILCGIINAQKIQIRDQQTGEPLPFATVSELGGTRVITSGAEGEVDLDEISTEKISISYSGYHTKIFHLRELGAAKAIFLQPAADMESVVVAATKWKNKKSELPFSVLQIHKSESVLKNPQTTADMLGQSGAVFIQKSQYGGGSPMIRGFATNRLLISVDGIRMNSAIFRSGNLQNIISLDPFNIESAEVLFGPGSVIYGSDAIGGVMNFSTTSTEYSNSSDPLIKGNAVYRVASASSEQTLHAGVKAGWKKWAMVTGISHSTFGNLRMGSNQGPDEYLKKFTVKRIDGQDVLMENPHPEVQDPSGFEFMSIMQKIGYRSENGWELNYGLHYSTTSNYSRYDRLIRVRGNGLPNSAEWYYGPQEWWMNSLSLTRSKATRLYDQIAIRGGYQFFEESRIDRNFNNSVRNIKIEKVHAYSFSVDAIKSLNVRHAVAYGAEYIYNKVNSTGWEENISSGLKSRAASRYPMSDWYTAGAFLTWNWKVREDFLLHAGGRYSYYGLKGEFDTTLFPLPFAALDMGSGAFNGSIGMVYQPTSSVNIHAGFSTGFRAPNVDDAGKIFDSEPGSVVVPNPNLKPEYVYNGELGISKVFGKVLKVDLTGFYTHLDKALVRRDFRFNGLDSILYSGEMSKVQAIQNAAMAKVYGLQAAVEVKLPNGFQFGGRLNYQKGEEELDDGTIDPLRHAAPLFGRLNAGYAYNNLNMEISWHFNSEVSYANLAAEERGKTYMYAKDKNGNPYSPSWGIVNLNLLFRVNDTFTVSGGVENIFDKRYRPYSSGIAAAGRNFIFSVRAAF